MNYLVKGAAFYLVWLNREKRRFAMDQQTKDAAHKAIEELRELIEKLRAE